MGDISSPTRRYPEPVDRPDRIAWKGTPGRRPRATYSMLVYTVVGPTATGAEKLERYGTSLVHGTMHIARGLTGIEGLSGTIYHHGDALHDDEGTIWRGPRLPDGRGRTSPVPRGHDDARRWTWKDRRRGLSMPMPGRQRNGARRDFDVGKMTDDGFAQRHDLYDLSDDWRTSRHEGDTATKIDGLVMNRGGWIQAPDAVTTACWRRLIFAATQTLQPAEAAPAQRLAVSESVAVECRSPSRCRHTLAERTCAAPARLCILQQVCFGRGIRTELAVMAGLGAAGPGAVLRYCGAITMVPPGLQEYHGVRRSAAVSQIRLSPDAEVCSRRLGVQEPVAVGER